MPEGIEVEIYRRAAEAVVGRRITDVCCPIPEFVRGHDASTMVSVLVGTEVSSCRRRGKLLLLDVETAAGEGTSVSLGLRFGMTGRLVVDGEAPIESLLYSTTKNEPEYERFALEFERGRLAISDPRRLGSVELDPDEDALGVDLFEVDAVSLGDALAGGRGALKSRLLDQSRVAGIGNLICDETLWRAGLAPGRVAGGLEVDEIGHLASVLRSTVEDLMGRGGSHMGDLQEFREPGSLCPADGSGLRRDAIGGRTTYWCPSHQR